MTTRIEIVSSKIHKMWTSWARNLLETEPQISEERKRRWIEDCFNLIKNYLKR
jgi:hypothetical protein